MVALAKAEIPCAPIWDIAQASTSEHAQARELVRGISELEVWHHGTAISVGASLGLAAYSGDTEAESLIERADRAMYTDKQHGGRAAHLTTNG